MSLDEGPDGYEIFKHKQDECIKIVLTPGGGNGHLHTHPHHHGPNGGRTH
jgi:hypothetical protein